MQLWDALGNTNLGNPDAEKKKLTYSKTLHGKTSDAQKNLHTVKTYIEKLRMSQKILHPVQIIHSKTLHSVKNLTFSHVGFLD